MVRAITRVFINRCRDKERLHARDRGASRNPAHVRVLLDLLRNSEETVKKEDYRARCTCFLGRKLTNVYTRILLDCERTPTFPARLRISLSLSFFFSHRRSILLSVLLFISSLSLSQMLIYDRVINSRFYSSLCTSTKT